MTWETRSFQVVVLLTPAVVLPAAAPVTGGAQTIVEIDDRIACPNCFIEAGPSMTLAAPADRFSFTSFPGIDVARDRQGNYITAPVVGDALVAVFGPDGGYRASYGRIGRGPGEFASDYPLIVEVGEDDVLYAVDPVQVHTLAPLAASSLNQVRLPFQVTDVVALGDAIAVQATVRTEAGTTTVQILRPDGTVETSIGATGAEGEPLQPDMVRRVLGRSNDGTDFWSAHVLRYRISRYGRDGEEKTRIDRVSDWFPPRSTIEPGAPFQVPANPGVSGIHQDADGLLWVVTTRAPRSFKPFGGGRVSGRSEMLLSSYMDMNRFLHTTVEVLDPVAGELVSSRDFDEFVQLVSTPGDEVFVFALRPDALGRFDCVVTPLKLRRE